jgi:alpha-D-ribose 1-methylphosphonate 5-triphosphate synthase subunit PhnL
VKTVLALLSETAPGKSVELRVPPYAAVQVVEGPAHRRGTPSAVVEMSAAVLIQLSIGETTWVEAKAEGRLIASGERSDLSGLFPIWQST